MKYWYVSYFNPACQSFGAEVYDAEDRARVINSLRANGKRNWGKPYVLLSIIEITKAEFANLEELGGTP